MNPAVKNCARWSALALGLGYGYVHNNSLKEMVAHRRIEEEKQHRAQLFQDARLAYQKTKQSQSSQTGVVTDPDMPGFDLEKLLHSLDK